MSATAFAPHPPPPRRGANPPSRSEECNRLLLLASVLGREFAVDALARLAGVSVDALLDHLDEAIAARVVTDVPGGGGHLRFSHVLIRDTLFDGIAGPRRAQLHRLA